MFHKASDLKFGEGTSLEVRFQDGTVKRYDMASLFDKYPQLRALENRELFLSGKLMGAYGIVWNDDLDIEAETIYEDGRTVRREKPAADNPAAGAVAAARALSGISQKQLSQMTGIDQSDISRIERGTANPSISTLERIAAALGGRLSVSIGAREGGKTAAGEAASGRSGKSTMEYRGYTGSVELSETDGVFYGKVQGISSPVFYEGRTAAELVSGFHESVDGYIAACGSEEER